MTSHIAWSAKLSVATLVLGLVLAACGDSTAPSSSCEIVYSTSATPGPSGIEIVNATGGGLSATVDSRLYVSTGSDMDDGDCNVWAYPAGTYDVRLQRCEQSDPGSSGCTSNIPPEVTRTVSVDADSRTRLRVDRSFFP